MSESNSQLRTEVFAVSFTGVQTPRSWRPDVRRIRNRRYGPARFGNILDVYLSRHQDNEVPAPMLVYFHGGGLAGSGLGGKSIFAHAMLYRLAARGWVCSSANYRMHDVRYAEQLANANDILCWAREYASAFGGDPEAMFVVGSSSGANLAATAALAGAPVRGVVTFYGFYGSVDADVKSPHASVTASAPPFLIVHGTHDALVPPKDARSFAEHLRTVSRNPIAYAELRGANHNFDFFPSLRMAAVTDGVQRFTQLVRQAHEID